MKKLSAEDNNELENYITELNDHASKIETRMHEANEKIVDLNDEIQAYNNILTNVKAFQAKITDKMDEYVDNKDEEWGETEEGSEYEEWRENWKSFDPHPLDLIDDINVDEARHPNELDELGDSP
jgi:hypothetical protein